MRIDFLLRACIVVARTLQRGCACCVIAVWMCCVVAALRSEKVACVQCCSNISRSNCCLFGKLTQACSNRNLTE
jgi:hypothetical protein